MERSCLLGLGSAGLTGTPCCGNFNSQRSPWRDADCIRYYLGAKNCRGVPLDKTRCAHDVDMGGAKLSRFVSRYCVWCLSVECYTLNLPEKETYLHSKEYYIDEMAMLLGGYIVEKEIFKSLTSGPSNDLRKVTSIAKDLIYNYGMSNELPPSNFWRKR